ncbi:SAM-dependent methyltransferase [Campylobacter geochelonis]|uniref:Dihydrodipicolinate reductase (Dhpr) n=1 Tax=Campylobacter geochelonis TaxID=1780362 RepID=A0A128EL24_9BACT|nr:SAM-dependent methyltransferase [Campylobacter geochelonis]QKF71126.1 SAM-dependent methyltransferase, MidA family [Campylobacter geochelonis]CZE48943.1 dihydrodipicolinate reductase (dhpr) [Campylobacter geochelonis]
MKFSEFFNSWLHENYYKKGVKVGKGGDFYTSVSVGSFFGICIAKKILSLKDKFSGKISIVEIGANEGYLLADIVQGIYTFAPNLLSDFEFCIIEPHENLQILQKRTFQERFGDDVLVEIFNSLNKCEFKNAIFISNELIDSFTCEVVDDKNMLFIEDFKPVFKKADEKTLNLALKFGIKKGEIPLNLESFVSEICQSAAKFSFITFDYGDMWARGEFSLRIYNKHSVYNFFECENLSQFFGKSDITYDVNFAVLKDIFLQNDGVKFEKFCSQGRAILDFGAVEVLELLLEKGGENAYKNGANQLKRLTHPDELGSRFKMIEFSKGI